MDAYAGLISIAPGQFLKHSFYFRKCMLHGANTADKQEFQLTTNHVSNESNIIPNIFAISLKRVLQKDVLTIIMSNNSMKKEG